MKRLYTIEVNQNNQTVYYCIKNDNFLSFLVLLVNIYNVFLNDEKLIIKYIQCRFKENIIDKKNIANGYINKNVLIYHSDEKIFRYKKI